MRIFRTIMLLTGVSVFMPSPPEAANQDPGQTADAAATQSILVTAARAVSDVATFCSRQPEVCDTAGYVAGRLEAKAKYSVRLIYDWASESASEPQSTPYPNEATTDPITTGSMAVVAASEAGEGQSTLRIEDLIPEWRGPVQRKKG
jgi:hypothetical protein